MKTTGYFFCLLAVLLCGLPHIQAALKTANEPTGFRLTVELQDGSKIIGKSGDDNFLFKSEVLGEIKLPLERVRSIECQAKTNSVKLTTFSGDTLAVQFAMKEIRVEAAFGNFKLPVGLIRRVQVSAIGKSGRPTMGLVALWSGDGNGVDAIMENNAIPVGNVIYSQGQKGKAFFLSGDSAYLQIPANPSLDVGKESGFTIECWINPTTVARSMPVAEFTGEAGHANIGVQFWISVPPGGGTGPGCFMANIYDANGADHMMSSPPGLVTPNTWQHIALSYDKASGTAVFYLNGISVTKNNLGSFNPKTSLDLLLGARTLFTSQSNPSDIFSGKIDEIGIYDRALTAAEIQAICLDENNGEPLPPPPTPAPTRIQFGSGYNGSF